MNEFVRKVDVIRVLKENRIDDICVNGVNIVDLVKKIPNAFNISEFYNELDNKFSDAFTAQNTSASTLDFMYYAGMSDAYCKIIEYIEKNYKINVCENGGKQCLGRKKNCLNIKLGKKSKK